MTRRLLTLVVLVVASLGATAASAQTPASNAVTAARRAAAAADAHTEAEQHPDGRRHAATKAPPSKSTTLSTGTLRAGSELDAPARDTMSVPPTIMREAFEYDRAGRRDPFVSLLTTNELRPTMSDLRLTGVLYDQSGGNSVATLRDGTDNKQYRVRRGSTLGRMRVTAIRTTTVVFTIDEFGTTRQDSLLLRDPSKERPR